MRIPNTGDHVSYYDGFRKKRYYGVVTKISRGEFNTIKVYCNGWYAKDDPMKLVLYETFMPLEEIRIHTPEKVFIDKEYESLYE